MHVNEDALLGFAERGYDLTDEEPDDDNNDEVANEHGEENGNVHGRNSNSNDRGEGGASGTVVGGNTNAASVGSGDGGPNNVPQEKQIDEAPNHGVEIQNNQHPSIMNVNSQVPNVVIPAMNNTNEEDNVPLNQMCTNVAQKKVPSIGKILIGLRRLSLTMSKRPPKHRGSTLERAISGTSMNRNTNVGPAHGFGNLAT
jgi:hypothetical protein